MASQWALDRTQNPFGLDMSAPPSALQPPYDLQEAGRTEFEVALLLISKGILNYSETDGKKSFQDG